MNSSSITGSNNGLVISKPGKLVRQQTNLSEQVGSNATTELEREKLEEQARPSFRDKLDALGSFGFLEDLSLREIYGALEKPAGILVNEHNANPKAFRCAQTMGILMGFFEKLKHDVELRLHWSSQTDFTNDRFKEKMQLLNIMKASLQELLEPPDSRSLLWKFIIHGNQFPAREFNETETKSLKIALAAIVSSFKSEKISSNFHSDYPPILNIMEQSLRETIPRDNEILKARERNDDRVMFVRNLLFGN